MAHLAVTEQSRYQCLVAPEPFETGHRFIGDSKAVNDRTAFMALTMIYTMKYNKDNQQIE